jgi:hypothetical protein
MRPTKILTLIGWMVPSITAGFLIPRVLVVNGGNIPITSLSLLLTLPIIGILLVVAAIPMIRYRRALASQLKATTSTRPKRVNPFYAVRLVLMAKAIAISGAIFAGWHIGLVWMQLTAPVVAGSIVQNALALFGSLVMLAAGIFVERICRLPEDGPEAKLAASGNGSNGKTEANPA